MFIYYIIMSQGKQFGTVTDGSGVAKTRVFIFYCADDWHKSHDYSGWLFFLLVGSVADDVRLTILLCVTS